jgi:hypothetical protein
LLRTLFAYAWRETDSLFQTWSHCPLLTDAGSHASDEESLACQIEQQER